MKDTKISLNTNTNTNGPDIINVIKKYHKPFVSSMLTRNPMPMINTAFDLKSSKTKNPITDKYKDFIWKLENENKTGYDKETDSWIAHNSAEGGGKTIGPGIKINSKTHPLYKDVKHGNKIKTEKLNKILDSELNKHHDLTKEYISKEYDIQAWDTLSPNIKQLLIRKSFNTKGGIKGFPKLTEAAVKGDLNKMKQESKSTYKEDGKTKPLTRENKMLNKLIHY